jgi:PIN domain nuclease of toxin-antitoxin system
MAAVLLDTHALIRFLAGEPLSGIALAEIAQAQMEGTLFVSLISAWEAGTAVLKPNPVRRPNLQGLSVDVWFKRGIRKIGAKTIPIDFSIALEAATIPSFYGSGDPGDCFLIATARVRRLTLLTRDKKIEELTERHPEILRILKC